MNNYDGTSDFIIDCTEEYAQTLINFIEFDVILGQWGDDDDDDKEPNKLVNLFVQSLLIAGLCVRRENRCSPSRCHSS